MRTMQRLCVIHSALLLMVANTWGQQSEPPRRLKNPRTIQLEGGSRVEFHHFRSPSSGENSHYSIYVPPSYDHQPDRLYPVIYFLHGMNNDHTSWTVERYGNIPAQIDQLIQDGQIPEFLMVHPDGGNDWYTDFLDGSKNAELAIREELIPGIEKSWRARADRNSRVIAGTSMGAYGALKIALKYPHRFSRVAAGSPIILLGDDPSALAESSGSRRVQRFIRIFEPMFGIPFDRDHWRENSVEALAKTADLKGLEVFFAYGTADRYLNTFPMAEGIRTLDKILTARNIPHRFEVYEGERHGWTLVKNHLPEFFKFLTKRF